MLAQYDVHWFEEPLLPDNLEDYVRMFDATAMIVGIVIGSGIFVLPELDCKKSPVYTGDPIGCIISEILSFFGALAYAGPPRYL